MEIYGVNVTKRNFVYSTFMLCNLVTVIALTKSKGAKKVGSLFNRRYGEKIKQRRFYNE